MSDGKWDGDKLLDIIKGTSNKNANNEGFVSYYMTPSIAIFARTNPLQTQMPKYVPVGPPKWWDTYKDAPPGSKKGTQKSQIATTLLLPKARSDA